MRQQSTQRDITANKRLKHTTTDTTITLAIKKPGNCAILKAASEATPTNQQSETINCV